MIEIIQNPSIQLTISNPYQESIDLILEEVKVNIFPPEINKLEIQTAIPDTVLDISVESNILLEITPPDTISILEIGISGGGAAADKISAIAGENLSGHRIVKIKNNVAYYTYPDDLEIFKYAIGMTTHAALKDKEVSVLMEGYFSEPSWNLDISKGLFLGDNGKIIQDIPTVGLCLSLGKVLTSDTIYLDIGCPIILS